MKRAVPWAIILLLLAVVAGIALAPRLRPPINATAVQSADLVMRDRDDGSVEVLRAADHRVIDTVPPASNGFLRVVLAGLVRERRRESQGAPDTPFHLTRWSDGRLTIDDIATGKLIELDAFGPDNAGAFARLLALSG